MRITVVIIHTICSIETIRPADMTASTNGRIATTAAADAATAK